MSEKQKEIVLKGYSQTHWASATKFLNDFAELVKQGYVLHPKPASVRHHATFIGFPMCVMVTQEYADEIMGNVGVVEKDLTPLKRVEQASKKDELLALASELSIEVPEDKKVPKAIKQFLIDSIK